jgi:hypothetical protein
MQGVSRVDLFKGIEKPPTWVLGSIPGVATALNLPLGNGSKKSLTV